MKNKFSIYKICIIAFAICLNIVGGQIALILRLPIYLDSMGTIFIASLLGPVYGMIPSTLSGLIFGFTMDIYSLYYAPVGIILGFIAGFVCKKRKNTLPWMLGASLLITIPGTIVSSIITASLFGGITSSGSSALVQILAKTSIGLTASCFIVQFCTDYLDRLLSLFLIDKLIDVLPANTINNIRTK